MCTIKDIFLATPSPCLLMLDGGYVSDKPVATVGLLTIFKLSTARFLIMYRPSAGSSIYENELYIGQLSGNDGNGITWNKVLSSKMS